MTEINDTTKFDRKISRLLFLANSIEYWIEWSISDYIIPQIYERQRFLMDEILIPSNFERKRQILKKICKKENISDHEQLLNSIKFVQDIRNKSAHGERFFDFTKQIKIQKRKIGGSLQEDFELTDELMEDIEQQTTYILKRLGELAVEFRKPHLDSLKE